jgi:ABC-type nitrate/sulfonate/bicarbonate transport system ATPase subunit
MVRLNALSFAYPGGQPLFIDFHWKVDGGDSWAVLGPSGCGKTTLLYLLSGLIFPTSGSVEIAGLPLLRPRPETGLVLQDYGLLPWATVRENISLGLKVRQFYGPDGLHAPSRPGEPPDLAFWLERLGLAGLESSYPGNLSGGQRQRVAIGRTLILQPDLLLLDEPFSSLDAPTRAGLEELTLQLWQERRFTFIVVTHAIEEAVFLGQHILVLGRPPHQQPQIFENPVFGRPDERDSQAARSFLLTLRQALEAA